MAAARTTYWEQTAETRWGRYITERQRQTLLLGLAVGGTGGVALEVGCEGGRWSALVTEHGRQMICTDVDAEALAVCARRLPEATCIQVAPTDRTLPVDTGSVGLVLAYEVLEVIESDWFPAEAARVLTPDGVLVCSYWNSASFRGFAYRTLGTITSGLERNGVKRFQGYYRGPPYQEFRDTLRRQAFAVVHEEGICWAPFSRDSDSAIVPFAIAAERRLGLRRLARFSPWVLTVAQLRR